jgi:hypothetical protein
LMRYSTAFCLQSYALCDCLLTPASAPARLFSARSMPAPFAAEAMPWHDSLIDRLVGRKPVTSWTITNGRGHAFLGRRTGLGKTRSGSGLRAVGVFFCQA